MANDYWKKQPRVPAGNEDGGEWTESQNAPNHDDLKSDGTDVEHITLSNHKEESDSPRKVSREIINYCESLSDEKIRSSLGYSFFSNTEKGPDDVLEGIIKIQGYDKLPQVVTEEEIHTMVKSGYIGFTRGMKVEHGAEAYRTGDLYVGRGVSGSGVYATAYTADGRYTQEHIAIKNAKKYAGYFVDHYTGSILVGALSRDARIVSKSELEQIRLEIYPQLPEKAQRVFKNNGSLAVALGYDAIDCGNNSYIIILNRSKTIVAK